MRGSSSIKHKESKKEHKKQTNKKRTGQNHKCTEEKK